MTQSANCSKEKGNMEENQERFNFNVPAPKTSEQLPVSDFLRIKEGELKQRIHSSKTSSAGGISLLIFVFFVSLIGLGTYSILENKKNHEIIDTLKKEQRVAGVSESQATILPVTGYGFSILPKQTPPEDFKKEKSLQNFPIFDSRQSVLSSFAAKITKDKKELKSGIEIYVAEYDNKNNRNTYDEAVLTKLGKDYEIKSKEISLPKGFQVSKIQNKQQNEGFSYYTTLTTENYYLIKIYNQLTEYPEYSSVSTFTDNILNNLYLN